MLYPISTHAPRTGSDDKAKTVFSPENLFQPTLPARGATIPVHAVIFDKIFQPTLPARGATSGRGRGDPPAGHFNPRSPHGERRHRETHRQHHKEISTHAPRTGSDDAPARFLVGIQISTHAPRTGSDRRPAPGESFRRDFNPRSPHGERRAPQISPMQAIEFQPTLPARGATLEDHCTAQGRSDFNPRSPHGERRSCSES